MLLVISLAAACGTDSPGVLAPDAALPRAEAAGAIAGSITAQLDAGKCLDVGGYSRDDGARVILWACHGGANQQWTPTEAGELRVYDGAKCLDVEGGNGNDGDSVILWTCHGGANQRWTLTDAGELRGMNGKCLDLWNGGATDGTKVVLYSCHGGTNQKWNAPSTAAVVARSEPAPAPAASPTGDGSTFFVSPGGSDAGSGAEGSPWRTIGHAITRLQPGQTLYVRGGTYVENIKNPTIQLGRPDARIRVAAYPGERPVIQGLLWLRRPSYWTIDGINVTWASGNLQTDHMVKMTNGVGWSYENSELWGARSLSGMLVYGSTPGEPANWVVRGNCIHDVRTEPTHHINGDHNLYVNTGTSAGAGLIERNILFGAPNGQNIKLGYGRSTPQPGDGTANVTVRYNTMYGSLKNLMVTDESHNNVIERNIIKASAEGYALRAYRLTGTNNVLRDNVVHEMSRLQYGSTGYKLVTDGGGNLLPHDPKFTAMGCGGFQPSDPVAQGYGRHGR